jgi:hypothetical protein
LACGCSLGETALRARKAGLAKLSDVALLKRLRKSQNWLYALCCQLFEERGMKAALGVALPMARAAGNADQADASGELEG